jgi:hypothetical protein
MIDLDKIYSNIIHKKCKDTCIGDINIRLILEDELNDLIQKKPYEQIAYCVLDENGNRHFDDEQAIKIKSKMPLTHQDEICNLIMKVNKFGITQEEIEKN